MSPAAGKRLRTRVEVRVLGSPVPPALQPSAVGWVRGDTRIRGLRHEEPGWYMTSPAPEDAEMIEKVRSLLEALDSAGVNLADRPDTTRAFVACMVFLPLGDRGPVLFLDDDALRGLVRHRLAFDVDLYVAD